MGTKPLCWPCSLGLRAFGPRVVRGEASGCELRGEIVKLLKAKPSPYVCPGGRSAKAKLSTPPASALVLRMHRPSVLGTAPRFHAPALHSRERPERDEPKRPPIGGAGAPGVNLALTSFAPVGAQDSFRGARL